LGEKGVGISEGDWIFFISGSGDRPGRISGTRGEEKMKDKKNSVHNLQQYHKKGDADNLGVGAMAKGKETFRLIGQSKERS